MAGALLLALAVSLDPAARPARAAGPPAAVTPAATDAREQAAAAGIDLHRVVERVGRNRVASQVAGPSVGPEQPISGPAGRPGVQNHSDVAFDGTNFLVVWNEVGAPDDDGSATRVVGTRVTPGGDVLDPAGIQIGGQAFIGGQPYGPKVAFGDGRYLVVWEIDGVSIAGAFVGTDGVPQGGLFLIEDGPTHFEPVVASNGTTFLVAWSTDRPSFDVVGALLDGDGLRLGEVPIAVGDAGADSNPAVASDGEDYLVTWTASADIHGARVDADGSVLDPGGFPIAASSGSEGRSSVAHGDTGYLVVWQDIRGGSIDVVILGSRVTAAGTVLDPSPLQLATGFWELDPSVAHDGDKFLVVWQHGLDDAEPDILGTRVLDDGTVEEGGVPISAAPGGQMVPAVAAGPGVSFVAWHDNRSAPSGQISRADLLDVWAARVASSGPVLDSGGLLLTPGNSLSRPSVAFNGTVYLVAWLDDRTGGGEVIGTRVRPDGTVLDPTGIAIHVGGASTGTIAGPPDLASDGSAFLVSFALLPQCAAKAVRVAGDGTILTPEPVLTGTSACTTPGVAFNGTNYLVATSESGGRIAGTRVNRSGLVFPTFRIADAPPGARPVAASVGGTVLVAWEGGAAVTNAAWAVTPIVLPPAVAQGGKLAVAASDTSYLLARMTTGAGLIVVRIAADGTVLDPSGRSLPGSGGDPTVAFYGSWLVVWNDRRTTGAGPGLYGVRVRRNGDVAGGEFAIAPGADADAALGVGAPGDGWTVAYPRYDATTLSTRMYLRDITPK